jgi:hypothetical protein
MSWPEITLWTGTLVFTSVSTALFALVHLLFCQLTEPD